MVNIDTIPIWDTRRPDNTMKCNVYITTHWDTYPYDKDIHIFSHAILYYHGKEYKFEPDYHTGGEVEVRKMAHAIIQKIKDQKD